jgi:hypothetical protein
MDFVQVRKLYNNDRLAVEKNYCENVNGGQYINEECVYPNEEE